MTCHDDITILNFSCKGVGICLKVNFPRKLLHLEKLFRLANGDVCKRMKNKKSLTETEENNYSCIGTGKGKYWKKLK